MVDSIEQTDNPTPEPPKKPNLLRRLLRPTKKKALGLTAIASMLGLGYYGGQWWAKQNLPPIIESQASKLINRPVDVGEIESISLTGVKVGKSALPPVEGEQDRVEVAGIDIDFNLLPVLLRRTLPVEVTLVQPKVFLDQSSDGEWLTLDLPESEGEGELPIELDIKANIEAAEVTAIPYQQEAIKVTANGEGRYSTAEDRLVEYDLDAEVNNAPATLKGNTVLATGKTDTKVLVKDLALDGLASLVPNLPVSLRDGVLNADLDVAIPSWEEITSANVEGTVNLQQVEGELETASQPIRAKSWLNFGGRNAEVKTAQATIGDLTAQVKGTVDLDTGYDLDVAVLPVSLSSLQKTFAVELPVAVTGEVASQIEVTGEIEQPLVKGKLTSTDTITVDREKIESINAFFTADLDKVVLKNLTVIPQAGGAITANGLLETDLASKLANKQTIDFTQIPLSATFEANLPTKAIAAPYYQLPSEVKVGNLLAEGNLGGTITDLKALVQWRIAEGEVSTQAIKAEKISGAGEILYVKDSVLLRDTVVKVGEGEANVTADANLKTKVWQGAVNTSAIALTPFLSQFDSDIEGLDLTRPITLEKTDIALKGTLDDLALETIQGKANFDFDLDGGDVTLDSQFADGKVKAVADTGNLAVDSFIPQLKIPVKTQVSSLNAESEIKPLLNIIETRDFSSITSDVTANVYVADGFITTKGSLANNQWQADIKGNGINTTEVVNAYAPDLELADSLQPIDTQANLTGSLAPFQQEIVTLPVEVNNAALQMGKQSVSSNGRIIIADLLAKPDVPLVDLAVNSQIDLDSLPIAEVVATAAKNNPLLAERVNVKGDAIFNGNFRGKNLISDSINLENYQLIGDLNLKSFAFNDIIFDPVMAGKVNVKPAEIISLDLQGKQDVIAASAVPCTAGDCSLPYLPNSLEFRQGENTNNPVVATGTRNDDTFNLNIENFPLALLNLAPGKAAGIEGALAGKVTGDITANLYNFAADGSISVEKPAVGYIEAKEFNAEFAYNPQENAAELEQASLSFGNTKYDLNGGINLATGELKGAFNIPQADVKDIFNALGWYGIEDALALFQKPEYVAARRIIPKGITTGTTTGITAKETIAQKLILLQTIEQQIQEIALARKASTVPTELDIQGEYGGNIILDGTIQEPEVTFNVEGNNWQWQPQKAINDIVPPLGLIKEESQFISIDRVIAKGKLEGTTVNLQQAGLQVEDTTLSATGTLSPTTQDASFKVDNLTVDTIGKFVNIPVDIAGRIDSKGKVRGTIEQPEIEGDLTVSNAAYNGAALPTTIQGNYNYSDRKLDFNTSEPSYIQVAATIPYPIEPQTNDTVNAEVKLEAEAFTLLDAFGGGYLTWLDGAGDADIKATAKLDLNRQDTPLYNLDATGVINLDNAQVSLNTPFFDAPVTATGKVNLHNQLVKIETLNATFAEKDVSATGTLPILYPVANLEQPLTIDIPEGDINIKKLYKGGVAGTIVVTEAALTPTIGGEVSLTDGKVSIPQIENQETYAANVNTSSNGGNSNPEAAGIVTTLDNLTVKLEDFKLEQSPLYEFGIQGDLNLNGTADTPENIKPEGTIFITQGDVDWLSSNFTLVRDRDNTVAFNPEAGVFNPYVNVQMKTEVSELDEVRQLGNNSNEVPDGISQVGRTEIINIVLSIDGEAAALIPTLSKSTTNGCNVRSTDTPPANSYTYSQAELDLLATCINTAASDRLSAQQLLDSSAISLDSTPNRRQGEIVNLLGNQFLGFAEKLQNSSQEELLELGVTQFVIAPIQRRIFYRVEDKVVGAGKKVGLDYLRVYPYLEGIYEINRESSVRGTYDYVFNEIKFEYQRDF